MRLTLESHSADLSTTTYLSQAGTTSTLTVSTDVTTSHSTMMARDYHGLAILATSAEVQVKMKKLLQAMLDLEKKSELSLQLCSRNSTHVELTEFRLFLNQERILKLKLLSKTLKANPLFQFIILMNLKSSFLFMRCLMKNLLSIFSL